MRITDYESTKNLTDVGLELTQAEAEELYAYLHRLLGRTEPRTAYLTELKGGGIERELTVTIERENRRLPMSA